MQKKKKEVAGRMSFGLVLTCSQGTVCDVQESQVLILWFLLVLGAGCTMPLEGEPEPACDVCDESGFEDAQVSGESSGGVW